jgi:DNA-binding winged helix-turn-helix (wHTH) protein
MDNGTRLVFNPFVLDTPNQSLLRGAEKIILRPKNYAVLDFLVRNPHRLITKTELMAALWPGAKVVDAALRVSIQEIRKALNDDAEHPKFIETVGKSGYRFIAPIALQIETLPAGGECPRRHIWSAGRRSWSCCKPIWRERIGAGGRSCS